MIPQLVRDWLQDCEDTPLTSESLKKLEAELDAELPKDYAEFLLQFNGGSFRRLLQVKFPEPTDFSDAAGLTYFLGVPDGKGSSDGIAAVIDNLDRFLAKEWLPIFDCEGYGYIILKFRGPGRRGFDGVWFWTPPYAPGDEEPPQFVAKTFTEFLQMIEIPSDEDFPEPVIETKPLFLEVERGNRSAVEQYLAKGGDPNATNEKGLPLLMAAVKHEWPQIVRLLLEHSADPNARDKQGETPLHLAAQWSRDSLKMLVAAGADTSLRDKKGKRPVDVDIMPVRNREFLRQHTTG